LLANGADANAKANPVVTGVPNLKADMGDTPLHRAAWEGRTETVTALLANGANPNAQNEFGNTPLHVAAGKGRAATVTALLVPAADRNAKDIKGRTPLQWATESGHTRAAALLE